MDWPKHPAMQPPCTHKPRDRTRRLPVPSRASLPLFTALLLGLEAASSQSLITKNYTTQDGLPDSRIAPVIQDRSGYLWFGAQAGLTRYDGVEFLSFGPASDVPGIFGRSILEDRAGAIWFAYTGFREGGVIRFWNGRTEQIGRPRGLHGSQALQIAEDRDGDLWIVTDAGLERLHFTDSSRTSWTIADPIDSLVMAVYASKRGPVYYATRHGFYVVEGDSIRTILGGSDTLESIHVRPSSFYETATGDIWFGGYGGAYLLEKERLLTFGQESGLPGRGVWCYRRDADGRFYAGTMEGLYRVYESGDRVRFVKEPSFGDAVVYDMCLDREGNLWLASAPGLRRILRVGVMEGFRGEEFLATLGIGAIRRGPRPESVCLTTRNAGLYIYSNDRIAPPIIPLPAKALTITDVAAENDSSFWMGLWRGGLVHLVGTKRTVLTLDSGLPSNSVHSLAPTGAGGMIVGTATGAALILPGDSVRPLRHPLLDGRMIFDLQHSTRDTLWAGTDDGPRILTFRGNTFLDAETTHASRCAGENVYAILIDSRRTLWFGTDRSGVLRFDGSATRRLTSEDGLPGNRVFALAEDSLGSIWIGTSSGLACYDGRSIHTLRFDQGFGEIGMHGLMTDGEGILWISNYPGVTRIRPRRARGEKLPPPLYLTGVLLDSTPLDPIGRAEIPHDPAIITFRFAALSFTDERNVRYRTILEGFDREWSPPTISREVRYTHLPHGEYRFKVIACSGEGVWTETPVSYSFTILPPIWIRWWFVAGILLLLVSITYAAYRYRLNRMLQLERTRNRIAMDLHDDLGSTLTRISVMTEVARRRLEEDLPGAQEHLVRIGEAARDLIENLGDIVWTVDPAHDDLQNVVRRIVQFGQELCEGMEIAFETELAASFETVHLTPDQRRDIYLVFKEGINNLVRHSGATRARFCAKAVSGGVLLELLDNGSGIPPGANDAGHGLASLRQRGERLGGRFRVSSAPGEGTSITLEIKTG